MLHTRFQASKPSGLKEKIFKIFFMYFYDLNLGPPGAGSSWNLGPSFEQPWQRIMRQCYIPNFKQLRQVVLKKKFLNIYVFLWLEPRTPGQRPSWTPGPSFEQTW